MEENDIKRWLDSIYLKHENLTITLVNDIKKLVESKKIKILLVTGRTKDKDKVVKKINKKRYKNLDKDITDITGIRVIVYFESDIDVISRLIESAFTIDKENSLDKKELLNIDQTGYRSVHFVGSVGGLKFEVQVRTVLQHVWAELVHDRYYHYSGELPENIVRRIYLYAGMLEMADKGVDELSTDIDKFIEENSAPKIIGAWCGNTITAENLEEFIADWSKETGFNLKEPFSKTYYSEIVVELLHFKIYHIDTLKLIIPKDYPVTSNLHGYSTDVSGLVRDWMLIHDYKRYKNEVPYKWSGFYGEDKIFGKFLSDKKVNDIYRLFTGN